MQGGGNMDSLQHQTIYETKDVAERFNIHSSTVRKYCDYLERAGYTFHKNEHGHRGFFDDDLIAFKKLMEYKDTMVLEQASRSVVAWKKGNDVALRATDEKRYSRQYSELLEEFQSFKEQQENFNQELLNLLKQQQEYMDNHLKERDQNLMVALKESLETQRQLASSKQKKWWKFWKR